MFPVAYGRGKRTKGDLLGNAPAVKSNLVGRNTVQWFDEQGRRFIRLHDTDILTFQPDGAILINTGGWNTPTTRDRLNAHLPDDWRVHTDRGSLVLSGDDRKGIVRVVSFRQKVRIGPRKGIVADTALDMEKDRKLIDGYMNKIKKMRELPRPDSGDPWVNPDKVTGKYSESNVRDWLKTEYVFGSFIVAAGRYAGLQDIGINMCMFNGADMMVRRRIRRYIRACLGYGT